MPLSNEKLTTLCEDLYDELTEARTELFKISDKYLNLKDAMAIMQLEKFTSDLIINTQSIEIKNKGLH